MAEPDEVADVIELHDPMAIRAIAHPARVIVIDALFDKGRALTATQAAELAGTTPSAMSYHLRSLARFGIVKRAKASDGRERPWVRAAKDLAIRLTKEGFSTAGAAATEAVLSTALEFDRQRLLAAVRRVATEGAQLPLDAVTSVTHTALLVTPPEAQELVTSIRNLLEPYRLEVREDPPAEAGLLNVAMTTVADPERPGAATPEAERS